MQARIGYLAASSNAENSFMLKFNTTRTAALSGATLPAEAAVRIS